MSDTLDEIDTGTIRMPNSTGENTTQAYGVWYPFDGALHTDDTAADALDSVRWAREAALGTGFTAEVNRGAMAVRITIERLDP